MLRNSTVVEPNIAISNIAQTSINTDGISFIPISLQ